jgi:hypothetical protein
MHAALMLVPSAWAATGCQQPAAAVSGVALVTHRNVLELPDVQIVYPIQLITVP